MPKHPEGDNFHLNGGSVDEFYIWPCTILGGLWMTPGYVELKWGDTEEWPTLQILNCNNWAIFGAANLKFWISMFILFIIATSQPFWGTDLRFCMEFHFDHWLKKL